MAGMALKTSLRGLAEIAGHEGIVPYPYRDSAGVWTFGIGHTASAGAPNPATMPKGEARPLREVMDLFAKDIAKYEKRVTDAVKVPITQSEFDALVSFDFNTGGIFRAQLTKHLNNGDRSKAAAAFDGWHRPPEIIPRRDKEKALFAHGSYSGSGMATVYPADANGRVKWSKGERVNVLSLLQPRQPDDPGPEVEEGDAPKEKASILPAIGVAGLLALGGFLWRRFGTVGVVAVAVLAGIVVWVLS